MSRERTVAAVEAFFARGGVVQGRLRERSAGDVLDVPCGPRLIPGVARSEDILAALESLANNGVVSQSLAVHRFDSSEYVVTWQVVKEGGRYEHSA